jgi:hypothetical protein
MDTSGSADPSTAPWGDGADDVADDVGDARERCRGSLDGESLQLITQISAGIPDFVVDTFDRQAPAHVAEDLANFRGACTSASRLLTTFADAQEARLEESRAGRLIRVVVHADGGAAYCYSVVAGQQVVGFTFVPVEHRPEPGALLMTKHPLVCRGDHAMTDLTNGLRGLLDLPTQNVGGWSAGPGPEHQATEDLVRGAVDPANLHYVARFRVGHPPVTEDVFDTEHLRRYFHLRNRATLRKFYLEFAGEMLNAAGQVNRLMRTTVGGVVRRIVLDVEQGALAYYRVGVGDYLVGVTLSQDQVSAMDDKLAWLANELIRA